jgi:ketosteroid isomerase-like protein
MNGEKQVIIRRFFEAYARHDMQAIGEVMDKDVTWFFLGNHPLAGVKKGLDEVIAFYDRMGKLMSISKPEITKLIMEENENYVIEVSHIKTNLKEENNPEYDVAVLWTIKNGKITEGKHFFADPVAFDKYIKMELDVS